MRECLFNVSEHRLRVGRGLLASRPPGLELRPRAERTVHSAAPLARSAFRLCWLVAATLASCAAAPGSWERLAPLPVGNGGFAAGALGEEIVVAGGTTWQGETKLWLDRIWAYVPARNVWREAGRLPAAVAYPTSGCDGQAVWFAGGSSGEATHRVLWKIGRDLVPRRAAALERGTVYSVGAIIGSKLYSVGGSDDQAAVQRIGHAFCAIDLRTGAMERLPDFPAPGVSNAGTAAVAARLYVFGGGYWDAAKKAVANHRSAHAYDVAARRWLPLPPLPHPGRGYSAVALDDRHILVAGGYRNDEVEFVADAFLFDTAANTYRPTLPLPYAGMVGLVKHGEWLYCLGGEDRKRHRTDAVFRIRWAQLLASPESPSTGAVPPRPPERLAHFADMGKPAVFPDGTVALYSVDIRGPGLAPTPAVQELRVRHSRNNGRTWSDPASLLTFPVREGGFGFHDTLVDRDGEVHVFLLCDANTGIIRSREARNGRPAVEPIARQRLDVWQVRSTDRRTRWEPPKRIWEGRAGDLQSVIQLRNGRMLLPLCYTVPRSWRERGEGAQAFTTHGQFETTVLYSDGGGARWTKSPSVLRAPVPAIGANGGVEPVLVQLHDGQTWRGRREILRDAHRDEPPPMSGDHGVAYPYPRLMRDGRIVYTLWVQTGAGRSVEAFDPAWLLQTADRDDFAAGLERWSVYGGKGAAVTSHPGAGDGRALALRKTGPDWPCAAVWNFPSARSGSLKLRVLAEAGFGGATLMLSDHFSPPFDEQDRFFCVYRLATGDLTFATDRWIDLELRWSSVQRACTVSIDAVLVATLPELRENAGPNYLRLRCDSIDADKGRLLIDSVEMRAADGPR